MTDRKSATIRFGVVTYLLYGMGYAVPSLRHDLGLSESLAGLHASTVAAGLIASGLVGERLVRWFGPPIAGRVAAGLLAASAAVLAAAGAAQLSLSGALMLGLSAGLMLSWVNLRLVAPGGRQAVILLARANVAALVSALAASLVIAAGDRLGVGGRAGLLAPLPILAVVEWLGWRRQRPAHEPVPAMNDGSWSRPLTRAYWQAWIALALGIGTEFSIVFWSASLVGIRTGAAVGSATAVAASFVAGMIVARLGLSMGIGTTVPQARLMMLGYVTAAVGVLGAWRADTLATSAIALFVSGIGVGPLYPVGIALALGRAPDSPLDAAARTTLASGAAILIAPVALAVMAQQVGLENAWPAVASLALIAVALLLRRPAAAHAS